MQTPSDFVHAGAFQQKYLRGMDEFLPEWGQDEDCQLKHPVYQDRCRIAKDTIIFPKGSTFRDTNDNDSSMENADLDGRFSDGDAEVPPQKRTKLLSAME